MQKILFGTSLLKSISKQQIHLDGHKLLLEFQDQISWEEVSWRVMAQYIFQQQLD